MGKKMAPASSSMPRGVESILTARPFMDAADKYLDLLIPEAQRSGIVNTYPFPPSREGIEGG